MAWRTRTGQAPTLEPAISRERPVRSPSTPFRIYGNEVVDVKLVMGHGFTRSSRAATKLVFVAFS